MRVIQNLDSMQQQQQQLGISLSLPPSLAQDLRKQEARTGAISLQQQQDSHEDRDDGARLDSALDRHQEEESRQQCLPVVLVDWKRLIGYEPNTIVECQRLQEQVQAALWGQESKLSLESDNTESDDDHDEALARVWFEHRVSSLFDSGVARHGEIVVVVNDGKEQEEESQPPSLDKDDENHGGMNGEKELLESCHSKFGTVHYPDLILKTLDKVDDTMSTSPPSSSLLIPTLQLWNALFESHPVAVVNRLRGHVRNCSRSLVWKTAMDQEILYLAQSEQEWQQERQREQEWNEWCGRHSHSHSRHGGRRKEQLDQLYVVRETFHHQVQMAQATLQQLEQARDEQVAAEMQKCRLQTGQAMGLQAFDFESTAFSFPSSSLNPAATASILGHETHDLFDSGDGDDLGLARDILGFMGRQEEPDEDFDEEPLMSDDDHEEPLEDGDDLNDDGEDDNDDYEVNPDAQDLEQLEQLEQQDPSGPDAAAGPEDVQAVTRERRRRQRRLAAQRQRQQRLQLAAQEAQHQARLETALQEEQQMRDLCTTPELQMAQARLQSLEMRLQQVDDLLESLQEEEWQEEEEQLEHDDEDEQTWNNFTSKVLKNDDGDDDDLTDWQSRRELSVLDEILAMILGSIRAPIGRTSQEHQAWLQEEHFGILRQWKEQYGRLPPSLVEAAATVRLNEEGEGPVQEQEVEKKDRVAPKHEMQQSMRDALGIVDNEGVEWDDSSSSSAASAEKDKPSHVIGGEPSFSPAVVPATESSPRRQPPKKTVVGLRPGGSLAFP